MVPVHSIIFGLAAIFAVIGVVAALICGLTSAGLAGLAWVKFGKMLWWQLPSIILSVISSVALWHLT